MALSTSPLLCSHHHSPVPELSITPEGSPVFIKQSPPIPSTLQPLANTVSFLSIDLPALDIPRKCSHTVCGLSCLASSLWHSVFRFHPCCSMHRCSIPFCGWGIFHNIPLYQDTTFCLSFHQLMNIWVVSPLGAVVNIVPGTFKTILHY